MRRSLIALTAFALATGTVALAGGHGDNPAVDARHAHMKLYSFNLGLLGEMAKGAIDYDAAAASDAANDLAALAAFTESRYWVAGTAQGEVEGSRAKAEIWSDTSGWAEKLDMMKTSSAALAAVAGDGLEALKAGVGDAGAACGACHKAYRGPKN